MDNREAVVAETIIRSSGRALVDIPSKVASRASHPKLVKFLYRNWKGDLHWYVVKPESIELGPYDQHGSGARPVEEYQWVFHGEVVTRDGDTRPDMGTRRRSFLMGTMERLEILEPES
jgi:hypothetical protein